MYNKQQVINKTNMNQDSYNNQETSKNTNNIRLCSQFNCTY